MTIISIAYIISTYLLGKYKLNKIKTIFYGLCLVSLSFFFEGPDKTYTFIGHNFTLMIIS